MTKVLFLKDEDGVFALFPELLYSSQTRGLYVSYSSVGQHSPCCKVYAEECERVKNAEEYQDLVKELKSVGYDLKILNKLL